MSRNQLYAQQTKVSAAPVSVRVDLAAVLFQNGILANTEKRTGIFHELECNVFSGVRIAVLNHNGICTVTGAAHDALGRLYFADTVRGLVVPDYGLGDYILGVP